MSAHNAWMGRLGSVVATLVLLTGCARLITGTPTWPGERLEKALLTATDFPPGTGYGRIIEEPSRPGGGDGPAPMLSIPVGCSNGLTDVITRSAERGRGSAAKYNVQYNGARIVMTVLTWRLNIDQLAATAKRCEHFSAYFDRASEGIPITTSKLPGTRPGQLLYQQTMQLHGAASSVFMSFENFDRMAVFGMAFPATQLEPGTAALPKAALPQTFIDVVNKQGDKVRGG
jgi:hypothetical protein